MCQGLNEGRPRQRFKEEKEQKKCDPDTKSKAHPFFPLLVLYGHRTYRTYRTYRTWRCTLVEVYPRYSPVARCCGGRGGVNNSGGERLLKGPETRSVSIVCFRT